MLPSRGPTHCTPQLLLPLPQVAKALIEVGCANVTLKEPKWGRTPMEEAANIDAVREGWHFPIIFYPMRCVHGKG